MKKIYLFFLTLLAVGFCAKAASGYQNVVLYVNNPTYASSHNGGKEPFEAKKRVVEDDQLKFYFEFTVEKGTEQGNYTSFMINSDSNRWGQNYDNENVGIEDNSHLLKKYGTTGDFKDAYFALESGTYSMWFNSDYKAKQGDYNIAEAWIQKISGGNTGGGDTPTDGSYYFYGDMNLWSSKNLSGKKVTAYTDNLQKNDVADKIFGSKENIPTYLSTDELEDDWKFKKVSDATDTKYETYLTGHGVASTDVKNWYYIDFKNLVDGEGHRGRLCGQFKITMGDHTDKNNWGISGGGYHTNYYKNAIVAGDTEPFAVAKNDFLQNMQLEANYVKDAVLYFNPDGHVLVEGTPIYNYVYYGVINGMPYPKNITKCELVKDNQENYYVNFDGFNNSDITTDEAKTGGNPKLGYYGWEEVTATNGTLDANNGSKYLVNGKIVYDGVEFSTVLRRRIPSGATHRFPISLTVDFADQDFSATEPVHCDDIWFINATQAEYVDVYFRYNDDNVTKNIGWVAYNIFNKVYKANVPDGYNYLFGGQYAMDGPQPLISKGEYGMLTLVEKQAPGDKEKHWWWKSPVKVPAEFATSSWVIFGESRGGVFPAERVNASNIDLEDVAMHGTDLYYVANANENPGLLYSHLNGTYVLSDHTLPTDAIQINAEMFDPETTGDPSVSPRLLTDIREVTYRYEIWNDGELVVHSCSNNVNEDAITDEDGFTSQPYFNWYVNGTIDANGYAQTFTKGYYFIVVKAKYKNKVYTAQDTYAIY